MGVLLERVVKDDSLRCSHLRGDMNKVHSENKDHGIWSHHLMGNRWGNVETVSDFIFWVPKSLQMVTAAMKLKDAYSLEEKL